MKRKNYKLLVEGWRSYLNEIAVDITGINKIKSKVDDLIETRKNSGRDIKFIVKKNDGKNFSVEIANYSTVTRMNKVYFADINDDIHSPVGSNIKVDGDRDPYVIKYSEANPGYGPLLYEIGLEIISSKYNSALMSDRGSVSDFAYRVWDRYKKRSESETNLVAVQMDFNEETIDLAIDTLVYTDEEAEFVKNIKQMTPSDPTDDVYQYSTIEHMIEKGEEIPSNWKDVKSPLAYAYYKIDNEIIEYIKSFEEFEGELFISEI